MVASHTISRLLLAIFSIFASKAIIVGGQCSAGRYQGTNECSDCDGGQYQASNTFTGNSCVRTAFLLLLIYLQIFKLLCHSFLIFFLFSFFLYLCPLRKRNSSSFFVWISEFLFGWFCVQLDNDSLYRMRWWSVPRSERSSVGVLFAMRSWSVHIGQRDGLHKLCHRKVSRVDASDWVPVQVLCEGHIV